MIVEVIWFVFGCWVAGLVLDACKLDKVALFFSFGGIPFHELSHLIACLALGVRVQSITLLHVNKAGACGNVRPCDDVRNPFTAFILALAPAVGAVFWTTLFAWGITVVFDAGYDQAWTWLMLYLAIATGTCAAPSGGDLRYAWASIAQHPGQFLVGLGVSLLAGWICLACNFPVAEVWHLVLLVIAVLGAGIATSKLYGWKRGV